MTMCDVCCYMYWPSVPCARSLSNRRLSKRLLNHLFSLATVYFAAVSFAALVAAVDGTLAGANHVHSDAPLGCHGDVPWPANDMHTTVVDCWVGVGRVRYEWPRCATLHLVQACWQAMMIATCTKAVHR